VEQQGWNFVKEFVEGGISGFKVSVNDRDAVQEIKRMAERREFDILGIYMSDRLGRIADETPLIVSFLNARGIKVISFREGEITANTHNDKLMTYIRYWQAEGESIKTSMRVTDAQEQSVKQGKWRGGAAAYGYKYVSRGTLNMKGKPIFDLEIDPEEAEVVRTIFRLYNKEKYSSGAIAKHLNDKGISSKTGTEWQAATVLIVLKNKLYIGIYELYKHSHRSGKNKDKLLSPIMEHLVIIPRNEWDDAQASLKENGVKNKKPPTRGGGLLLSGLLYCGECGQKFTSSHWSERRTRRDGTIWEYATDRYRCISYIKPKEREEQCHRTVYRVNEVDEAVLADTKQFLASLNKEKIIDDHGAGLKAQLKEISEQIKKIARDAGQKERELQKLKDEVLKVIMGESKFSQNILSDLIQQREKELAELAKRRESAESAEADLESQIKLRKMVRDEYKDWEQRFDTLTIQEKRAMLIKVIDRIIIYPDRVHTICKVKVDVFENATIETTPSEGDNTSSSDTIFYPKQLVNTDTLAIRCIIRSVSPTPITAS